MKYILTQIEADNNGGRTFAGDASIFSEAESCARKIVDIVKEFGEKYFDPNKRKSWDISPEWFRFRYEDGLYTPHPDGDQEPLYPDVLRRLQSGQAVTMQLWEEVIGYGSDITIHAQQLQEEDR